LLRGVDLGLRVKRNAATSKARTAPAAGPRHRATVRPVAPAVAEVAACAGATERAAEEVVDVSGTARVVEVVEVCCAGDPSVAVKENRPLTGWPSPEVARQSTVYRPAGDPARRRWVMVLPARAALPV